MITRAIYLSLALVLVVSATIFCAAQQSISADGAAEKLAAQIRAVKTETEQLAFIDTKSESELNALCNLLAAENAQARVDYGSDNLESNVSLIRKIAARVGGNSECQGNLMIENAAAGNDFKSTVGDLKRGLSIFEATGNKEKQAHILSIFCYSYRAAADYEIAAQYHERVIKLYEELKNYKQSVEFINGLGAIKMYQGDFAAAETNHGRALQIAEAERDAPGIANSLFHLGIIYRARGNYSDSLRVYQRARLIIESLSRDEPKKYLSSLSTCLRHLGLVYYLQGINRLALEYFQKSLAIDEATDNSNALAYSLLYIARVYFAENDYPKTLELGERALKIYREAGEKEGTALALNLLGYTQQKLGNFDRALDYFKQSLDIRKSTGSRNGTAVVQTGMANIYQLQGKYAEAVEFASSAVAQFEQDGSRELLWQAQTILGKSYRVSNRREKALAAFNAATGVIENLRRDATGGENERGVFFAGKVEPYQQAALIFAEQSNFAAAFNASEQAKARVLLDVLKFGRVEQSARLTEKEQADEKRLRDEIVSLNTQINRLASQEKADAKLQADLQIKLEKARLAYTDFQSCAFAAHPELKLQRGEVETVSAKDVSALLDEKTALLEYLVTGEEILLFVFTKSAGATVLNSYRMPIKRGEIQAKIAVFRQKLATGNLLFAGDARSLYDLLLKPAREQLSGKTSLVIVPDDGLWELPFQALQSAENHYVLDDAAISYAPSLTILRELRERRRHRPDALRTLLALGNPSAISGANLKINFAALPEAERQVFALRDLYGGAVSAIYTRAAAREEVFKREAANFRIIHLATHGFLDNNNPLASYVLLSAGSENTPEDGRLEAREILEMNLNADLVVLSACETARGTARPGEGIIGLAWSLMVAGTRSVAVSQWKVESASTTELMRNFYQSFKSKNASQKTSFADKSAALRQAALKLRRSERFAHPFYWAGFVLIGETN
jgi:CHAT domain-containing protein